MRTCVLTALAAVAGLLNGIAAAQNDAVKNEMAKFNGRWQAVSVETDGKAMPRDEVAKVWLVVKGSNYTFHVADQTIEGTHKLDPTKSPKRIAMTVVKSPDKKGTGETDKGIYLLEGDSLKICHFDSDEKSMQGRPKQLVADADTVLAVLKREKK